MLGECSDLLPFVETPGPYCTKSWLSRRASRACSCSGLRFSRRSMRCIGSVAGAVPRSNAGRAVVGS